MRNLQLRRRYVLQISNVKGEAPTGIVTATASDGDSVICAFGPSKDSPLLVLRRWNPSNGADGENITSFDVPCPLPDLDCDRVLILYYLPEKSTICIVLVGGDIVLVREDPLPGEEKIEIVGSVEVGLTAAEWSPDGELLVLTTRADTLLYMTREFENSVSCTLTEDDLKASKHVDVGWGKKETQFTGRGARALRDPTMPEKVDEGVKSALDDSSTAISWRGDGQFFAVNSCQASSRRVIRVYSREGVLDSVTEPVDNLEPALSWRPAGNLIAGIRRHADRVDVVFFERNGLRHGEFSLRPPTGLVKGGKDPMSSISLHWNCDSSILAVCMADRFQLWTMGNYHYYLKHETFTGKSPLSQRPVIEWDAENPYKLIVNGGDVVEVQQYVRLVSRSSTWESRTGTVAVIDGQTLKVTSLRYANIPPPMAQEEVQVSDNVLAVSVLPCEHSELIGLVTTRQLLVYEWRPQTKNYMSPKIVFEKDLNKDGEEHLFSDIAFQSRDTVILSKQAGVGTSLRFIFFSTEGKETDSSTNEFDSSSNLGLVSVSPFSENNVYAFSTKGDLLPVRKEAATLLQEPRLQIAKAIEHLELVHSSSVDQNAASNDASEPPERNVVSFGMTRSGALYANNRCLTRDCTSFVVTSAHLVYTTSKHLLKFIHLGPVEDLIVPPDTPEIDERCRSVERGARIVTVIQPTSAAILQMPRGNLETIYPRALVLAVIRKSIDQLKYMKAFRECRKQRVDMNILYDYKPEQFLSNAKLFVDQLGKVEYIDLFLSQLRDEDVSASMYKDTLPKKEAEKLEAESSTSATATGKINKVCDALLHVLRDMASTNLQNIITAHVVKSPPDIDAGLLEVAKFQKLGQEEGERAVEHICFLVDVNRLYENALGLYDLRLAVLVAQKSQKDPKEYLPFLRRLHDLPEGRRKFDINDYLDRNKKALTNLWDLNDFEEYKKYTVKHGLYQDALNACHYDEARYKEVMTLYADWLQRKSRHREAGIAFEYLQNYDSATESYRLAYMWRESLSSACLIPYEDEQLRSLASLIIDSLIETKEFHAAASISRDHLQDLEQAARLFCRGYHFADAISVLSLHKLGSKIPDIVDSGLTECMGITTELLADCRSQLKAQIPRIRELRVKQAEHPLAYYEGTEVGGAGADIPDNISLAATDTSTMGGGSLFTRYTGKVSGTIATNASRKTAKHKRKEERKRAQGKKGSVYEEEYLVNSVGRLFDRVNSVSDDVERLVVGLMRRGMRERARAVETAMQEVVDMCSACRDEVFQIEHAPPAQKSGGAQPPVVDSGINDEGIFDTEATVPKKEPPAIREWKNLTLLVQHRT